MIKRLGLLTILWTLLISAWGQNMDYQILCHLQQHRTPTLDKVMKGISNSLILAPAIPAGMMIGGWIDNNQPVLNSGKQIGGSLLATGGITIGLKYAVGRKRPYQKYPMDLESVTTEPDPSFPSGHTSFAFSTAVGLSLQYPEWYIIAPSLIWASAIGFSRLYLGVHFPSDVVTGMAIGSISAYIGYQIQQRKRQELDLPPTKIMLPTISITF